MCGHAYTYWYSRLIIHVCSRQHVSTSEDQVRVFYAIKTIFKTSSYTTGYATIIHAIVSPTCSDKDVALSLPLEQYARQSS